MNTNKGKRIFVFGMTEEESNILQARGAFVEQYCQERNWNVQELPLEKLLEIRRQPGWKNPLLPAS